MNFKSDKHESMNFLKFTSHAKKKRVHIVFQTFVDANSINGLGFINQKVTSNSYSFTKIFSKVYLTIRY